MSNGNATIINGKVYFGGGTTENSLAICCVQCYDTSLDTWTTLPPLPVAHFGIGKLCEKVVAIGGQKVPTLSCTSEWYRFSFQKKKWKTMTPSIPRAVSSPAILSLCEALLVAGGTNEQNQPISSMSVFKFDTQQWVECNPLPDPCPTPSPILINNEIYMLLGCQHSQITNQALHTHTHDLLRNTEAHLRIHVPEGIVLMFNHHLRCCQILQHTNLLLEPY